MKLYKKTKAISLFLLISGWGIYANSDFTNQDKTEIISKLAQAIKDGYVLVEEGNHFSQELLNLHDDGFFESSSTKKEFVETLNEQLFIISNDKHLRMSPIGESSASGATTRRVVVGEQQSSPKRMAKAGPKMVRIPAGDAKSKGPKTKRVPAGTKVSNGPQMKRVPMTASIDSLRKRHFGGKGIEAEILPGNVGLITIHDLMGTMNGIDDAMAKLADTDGLIIDVRQCPGGVGFLANQLSSYFIPEGQEIMRMHTRGQDVNISYSVALPKGAKRYMDKPFYLVTSGFTGSACEALSFALKYHNRGIVFGETTAGAGHAATNGLTPISHNLEAFIPNSRPEHPNQKGGFEKKGVTADIEANALFAVKQAHQNILVQLVDEQSKNSEVTEALINVSKEINDSLSSQVYNSRKYGQLVGNYEQGEKIIIDKGQLKYVIASGRSFPLENIDKDTFKMVFSRSGQTLKIERNADGEVSGYRVSPRKGQSEWQVRGRI